MENTLSMKEYNGTLFCDNYEEDEKVGYSAFLWKITSEVRLKR